MLYIFLTTPDEVEKCAKIMQSNSSDKYLHRYNIEILSRFEPESELLNTRPMIENELKELLSELKKLHTTLVLECKKRNDRKIFHSSTKLIASDSDNDPNRHNRDITSLHRRRNFDKFHVISKYFFDVISLIENSTLFSRTFFGVISLVEKSTLFLLTYFDIILMVEKSTLLAHTFFDNILMGKNSTLFFVKLQANENILVNFRL